VGEGRRLEAQDRVRVAAQVVEQRREVVAGDVDVLVAGGGEPAVVDAGLRALDLEEHERGAAVRGEDAGRDGNPAGVPDRGDLGHGGSFRSSKGSPRSSAGACAV